ncbi:hypothetical protein F4826_004930 [Rahnella inusitata]|nr:hypothetical protein [Rahnella inusitata]
MRHLFRFMFQHGSHLIFGAILMSAYRCEFNGSMQRYP